MAGSRDPTGRRRTGSSRRHVRRHAVRRAGRAMGSLARARACARLGAARARRRRRPTSRAAAAPRASGPIVTVSVLSAVLASGGTVLVLERAGAFDQRRSGLDHRHRHPDGLPAAGDHRRVVGGHRRRREGRARRRQDRHRRRRRRPVHRAGRRLGPDLRLERLDPHQPARDRRRQQAHRRAQGRPPVPGHGLRHRHPDRPRDRQDRPDRPADRADRPLRRPQGGPAGGRDRQPARDLLVLGHQRHRVGQGPRRSPSTAASGSRT